MSTPVITVQNISKRYQIGKVQPSFTLQESLVNLAKLPGRFFRKEMSLTTDFWALKDIDFSISQNEVVGIIGRNGSGKSTLLKILSRITFPTTGQAMIKGRLASLLEVGTGFNQELTGRENVFLNGSILGMSQSEIRMKFDEIIEFSGVGQFIDTPVKRYSSGMYVRLAFAVAAHLDPDILIIDEVLAVGDAGFQKKCLKKMDQVAKEQNRTVLFVSHNLDMVRQICNRCILLDKGEIIYIGNTNKAIKEYFKLLKNTDLSNDENAITRIGSGHISITGFSIRDSNSKRRSEFEMGEDVYFKIRYKINEDVEQLVAYLAFKSSRNSEILTSIYQKVKLSPLKSGDSGSILLKIPKINLRPNTYPIKVFVGEDYGISPKYEVIDDVLSPLTIISSKYMNHSIHYDLLKNIGYYSIESQIVKKSHYAEQ